MFDKTALVFIPLEHIRENHGLILHELKHQQTFSMQIEEFLEMGSTELYNFPRGCDSLSINM